MKMRVRDRGAVLPMVLVVAVVLSVLVVAIADYAAANLRYGRITEARSSRLAAADAAMNYALDQLKVGAAACIYNDVPVQLPAVTDDFNGATGDVICDSLSGGLDDRNAWAAVVTGDGVPANEWLVHTQGGAVKTLSGSVWVSRVLDTGGVDSFDLANNAGITIDNAPLVHEDLNTSTTVCDAISKYTPTGPQPKLPSDVKFDPDLMFGPICSSEAWYDQDGFREPEIGVNLDGLPLRDGLADEDLNPQVSPVLAALGAQAAYYEVGSGSSICRVYRPGRYLRAPLVDEDSYFEPGDYYFDFRTIPASPVPLLSDLAVAPIDESLVSFDQAIATGGRIDPASGATRLVDNPSCAGLYNSGSGYGVTFYLGANAHIEITNQATVELFPRQHGADYVTIHALCSASGNNHESAWCLHSPGAGQANPSLLEANTGSPMPLVLTNTGSNKELILHGHLYAPLAFLQFGNVANNAEVRFRGGLTVAKVDLQSAASADSFQIGGGSGPVDVITKLTSTGKLDGEETKIVAIVEYDAGAANLDDRLRINSWRVCDQGEC